MTTTEALKIQSECGYAVIRLRKESIKLGSMISAVEAADDSSDGAVLDDLGYAQQKLDEAIEALTLHSPDPEEGGAS